MAGSLPVKDTGHGIRVELWVVAGSLFSDMDRLWTQNGTVDRGWVHSGKRDWSYNQSGTVGRGWVPSGERDWSYNQSGTVGRGWVPF